MGCLVLVLLIFVLMKLEYESSVVGAPQVPCFFIFGDSLVDNGNNNNLMTEAKVNYKPYGVDFPGRSVATGRFTNGLTMADILTQLLGFDTFIPPFATTQGTDALTGLNYASGSAGIREETGSQLGFRYSLDRQLVNHNETISGIAQVLGNETKTHLGKCLYYFVVGSNDYINNYYQPDYYPTRGMYTPQQYATTLVQQFSQQLKTLYELGARKISVSGLGPLGCLPAELARGTNGSACVDPINDAVRLFNDKLKLLVDDLNKDLPNAEFVYIGAMDLRPTELFALGIRILSKPCCKVSSTTGLCLPGQSPCLVRSFHFFFDNFHPTEIINRIAATFAYLDILKLIS